MIAAALGQAALIGSALSSDVRLVYQSGGVEQAPWAYDSVRVLMVDGFDRCVMVARRGQPVRESCARGDTLFDRTGAGAPVVARPIGPDMLITVTTAAGSIVSFSTGAVAVRELDPGLDVRVLPTTIVTRDSAGVIVRRLREEYSPELLTAVRGVFEEPDGAGGWAAVREFSLARVERPARH